MAFTFGESNAMTKCRAGGAAKPRNMGGSSGKLLRTRPASVHNASDVTPAVRCVGDQRQAIAKSIEGPSSNEGSTRKLGDHVLGCAFQTSASADSSGEAPKTLSSTEMSAPSLNPTRLQKPDDVRPLAYSAIIKSGQSSRDILCFARVSGTVSVA